jgi:hypothetical protein
MAEQITMVCLVTALVGIAAYYCRKSWLTLKATQEECEMLPEERLYLRRQAWRRLVNSGFMIALAVLLAGSYVLGFQARAEAIGRERELQAVNGVKPPLTPEQQAFGRFFSGYVIVLLVLLAGIIFLAGVDLFATRRFAITQLRRIQADRRAMMERQLDRWRRERDRPSLN